MKKGFTLAEVLITLAIIGIVAAITIPSLMADVNQKAFDNQRKTLHSRLANALTAMDRLSGYGVYDKTDPEDVKDTAAESFLVDGLSKVYKIRNICDKDHFAKCGVNESFSTINGDTKNMPKNLNGLFVGYLAMDTINAMAFETNNGESIVLYYNPKCENKIIPTSSHRSIMGRVTCANFIYDLNGPKAPNMMGKDMGFITAFYKEEPVVVAPMLDEKSITGKTASSLNAADICDELGSDYRLPTMEEAIAAFLNQHYMGTVVENSPNYFWTSDITKAGNQDGKAVAVMGSIGYMAYVKTAPRSDQNSILCIKR